MLIVLSNGYVKAVEIKLLKKFCRFVLDKFVKRTIQNNSLIVVKIVKEEDLETEEEKKDLLHYRAWCTYDGIFEGRKKFTVVLKVLLKDRKSPVLRLKELLINLGHELIHVKQYLNGEMRDYADGSYKFLGEKFDPIGDDEKSLEAVTAYYESPCEIEAYGREQGLYSMFKVKLKEEVKIKK